MFVALDESAKRRRCAPSALDESAEDIGFRGFHPRLLTRTAAFAAEDIALTSADFVNGR